MKKTLCIWISVFVIILCLVAGFGVGKYYTVQKTDDLEECSKCIQDGNQDGTEENQEKVDGNITFNQNNFQNIIDIIPAKEKITNAKSDFTNQEKIALAVSLYHLKNSKLNFSEVNEYKGADLKNVLLEYFGNDLNVKMENTKCILGYADYYVYDSKTDIYKYNDEHPGHGADDHRFATDNYIYGYEIIENIYKVKVKKLFFQYDGLGPALGYYTSYNEAVKNYKEVKNYKKFPGYDVIEYEQMSQVYDLEKDKLPVYTYTFEKVGDNFIFKGYELSK